MAISGCWPVLGLPRLSGFSGSTQVEEGKEGAGDGDGSEDGNCDEE